LKHQRDGIVSLMPGVVGSGDAFGFCSGVLV
jgi:hypothetical protein